MIRHKAALAAIALAFALGSPALAGTVHFDFEGTTTNSLSAGDGPTEVSAYMSEIYGSSVTATDTEVSPTGSGWTANSGNFIENSEAGGDKDFEIVFADGRVGAVRFTGFVDEDTGDEDFRLQAFDDTYADDWTFNGQTLSRDEDSPNASSYVGGWSWSVDPVDSSFDSGWIYFNRPVTLLVFSDHGSLDVAIDDLYVRTVPLPAAAWMGFMMLGGLGLARRRKRASA
jgi:hypothetical protein